MAPVHGSKTKVFANGYHLSRFLRSATASGTKDVAETSAFNDEAKTYIYGLKDATLSCEGMFDGSASAVDEVLTAALGATTESEWTVLPAGDTIGNRGWGFSAHQTTYEVSSPVDDVCMITAEAQSNVGREQVISHQAYGTVSASGTASSVVDNSVGTNGGGVAYLHATFTGSGTAVVKIQDSSDNVTYADHITFSNLSGTATSSERVTVSGTVDRYTRTTHTITGSGTLVFTTAYGRL